MSDANEDLTLEERVEALESATLTHKFARGGIIRGPLNVPTGGCVIDTSKHSGE
ncbi:hypothetical protein [Nocardiopsis sp. NRRL B-16309]|uniref:hypothetical protein n=1 Tax=Nocardiopsis sp. NRRL B-16309 TaxID=1519494 RepID=UPI000AE198C1|nr:hypothetical protein [Nocardiopsis sp. NRRL B-16309]